MKHAIVVENLVKHYGNVVAVDNISFEVPKASIYGFVGPNGAGKTTTIKMLCCLLKPTSGKAWINGIPIEEELKIKEIIGYLPENLQLYKFFTVEEHIRFIGKLYKIEENELKQKIRELLETVNMRGFRKRKCGKLSKGQQRRVGIAISLINDPEILILDEPTSGLDPLGRKDILNLLLKLRSAGKTIFLSSHILPEISQVCTHIGVINRGKLLFSRSIDDLKQQFMSLKMEVKVEKDPSKFIDDLETKDWVKNVKVENNRIVVEVLNMNVAKVELIKVLAKHSLPVVSLRILEPNLEDLFIKMLGGK
ncbi:MAG: ATP-binding cassette domain-containing protein [Candidatus Baldrarchaeota archaeon]